MEEEKPTWYYHYDGHPLTEDMKKFIMDTISDRLDKVILDGRHDNMIVNISLNPNEKILSTVSTREVPSNKRRRPCAHLDSLIDSIHN